MNLQNRNPKVGLSAGRVGFTLPARLGAQAARRYPFGPPRQALKISVFNSFEAVRDVWLRFEREADAFAFQTYRWLYNWYEFVGAKSDMGLCITLVETPDGAPIMLLPLAVERRGLVWRLVWLGGRVTDYRGPLLAKNLAAFVDANAFPAVWRQIRERLPHHDVVVLESQPEFIGSQRNPFSYLPHAPHVTNAYSTALAPTLEAFLKSKHGGRWVRDQRRKERRLGDHGQIAFRVAANTQDVGRMLPVMMAQKSEAYRELGVRDLFVEPGCREFFEHMSRQHVRDGFVHLSALTVDNRIQATHWGLVHRGRFYFLLPAYARDPLARFSPGNVMLRRLFEWCIAHDVETFDLTIGDEAYKDEWCDRELKMFDCIEADTPRGWAYATWLRLTRAGKRWILRSPLRRPARSLRLWLGRRRWG
jgi:CelD/BcsL family acetyltransferase involved in cellulose biosynthesis